MSLKRTRAAKLTAAEVMAIRTGFADGATQNELARHYHISIGQIGRITRGESWQDLPEVRSDGQIAKALAELTPEQEAAIKARADDAMVNIQARLAREAGPRIDAVEEFQRRARASRGEPTGEGLDKLLREAASPEVDELINTLETKHD